MQSILSHFKVYNLVLLVICTWACRAHIAFSLSPVMRCWFKSSDHFYTQPPVKTIFIYIPNIGPPSDQAFTNISHSLCFHILLKVIFCKDALNFDDIIFLVWIIPFGLYHKHFFFFFLPNTQTQKHKDFFPRPPSSGSFVILLFHLSYYSLFFFF